MIGLRGLHPEARRAAELLLEEAEAMGLRVRVTSGFRSLEEQYILRDRFEKCVATGRFPSPPDCKFPANRPGDSAHNFGLAFDSVLESGDANAWLELRESYGFRVPPNDVIHSEVPDWRNVDPDELRWDFST